MRTTLIIDDDVLSAAKELAAIENKTVGEVISSLARRALSPAESRAKTRNGMLLLKARKGAHRVTRNWCVSSAKSLRQIMPDELVSTIFFTPRRGAAHANSMARVTLVWST